MTEIKVFPIAIMPNRRQVLRVHRRHLRDATDPFHIPEARFLELFRFSKEAAISLLNELGPYMKTGIRRTFIPKSIRLTSALHYYATGSFRRDTEQDFGCAMSKTMICRIVKEITHLIEDKLMDKYVQFPTMVAEQNALRQRFFSACGFPGVIGCIDCIHIKIKKPEHESVYRNSADYYSKNVQLICDYDLRILGCYARYGGSTHAAAIWEKSKVQAILHSQYRRGINTCWLLGGTNYPQQPWLMTPYSNPADNSQLNYNQHHTNARNCLHRLTKVLKTVFLCLSDERGLLVEPAYSGTIINACITLHNIRKHHNLPMPEETLGMENNAFEDVDDKSALVLNNFILKEGREVRDSILLNYFR